MVFGIWKEGMVDKCLGRYGVRDESLVRMDMERGKEETNINEMDDTGNGELIRTHKSHRTYVRPRIRPPPPLSAKSDEYPPPEVTYGSSTAVR